MVVAETFVSELDAKNQTSIQRVVTALNEGLGKEGVEVADALRMALKAAIELAEVAALWITDCDDLEMKLSLAEQCGDGARQCRRLSARIVALGVPEYDPRNGGYSKLFAFLRSLQTPEERSSAGYVTGKALSMARLGALGAFCADKGDAESARLLAEEITGEERRYYDEGRRLLVGAAATEESQARARRAAYRTLELAGETVEPLALRKTLGKRR
ncbi:MAG TPA: ferritin-like domain-containing protein [Polyangia bacterium]|nr:ferritin-like domain-containing protein [Polyangia bacterium]